MYTKNLGDGDSAWLKKSFRGTWKALWTESEKLECVGHVQKGCVNSLRRLYENNRSEKFDDAKGM